MAALALDRRPGDRQALEVLEATREGEWPGPVGLWWTDLSETLVGMAPDNETVLQDVPFFEKLDDEERKTLAGQIET